MEKIGALWIKEGAKGKFMSGVIGGKQVLIFKNTRKKEDKHPDYEVFNPGDKTDLPPKKDDEVPF